MLGRIRLAFLLAVLTGVSPAGAETATSRFTAPGLEKPAEIIVDRWGVPHIYAGTLYDAFWAQGFNAARDRLWQIDLWRRRGLGLLAETFGPSFVAQDRAARLLLYRGDMYREWLAYGSDTKRVAEAFVAGVNAYVGATKADSALLPPEFRLLGYEPSYWRAEDVARIRSHGLTRNLVSEVERSLVACKAGLDADLVRRGLEPPWQTTVPRGLDPCAIPEKVLGTYALGTSGVDFEREQRSGAAEDDAVRQLRAAALDTERTTVGSNNWTVAPQKSATGRPILANDPHRAHSVPSLRYIAQLTAPGLSVIGAGEPGLPGISIGHNGQIAFGLTIFGTDQEDLYVYETDPADPLRYRYGDGWERMVVVGEQVQVKGGTTETVELKFTRHGPVLFESPGERRAFALRAAWLEPGMAPYFGSIDYMRARNWDQFLAAMNRWGAPSENQVYADADGNIGWKPAGLTPIRPNWDGLMPVPGDGRYEWAGFRDMDELPVEFNPPRGWVGSANQMNLPAGYPYKEKRIGFEWTDPFRYNRLSEVLSALPKVSLEDSKRLQMDYLSLPARRLVALVGKLQAEDAATANAIRMLTSWNFSLDATSGPAALAEVWVTRHLRPAAVGRLTPPEIRKEVAAGDFSIIIGLLEQPDQRFGPDPGAARNALLLATLKSAVEETENLLGPDRGSWQWGKLHHAFFQHPIAATTDEKTRAELNVGPMPKSGSGFTVSASTYRPRDFRLTAGASFRMVVDVGNWDGSWAVNTPGQSGDPRSPHYRDLAEKWLTGDYFPLLYSRDSVEKAAEQRIVLTPSGG